MTIPQNDPLAPVREIVKNQPWYKELSKAITGGVGALISVVWLATSFGLDIPDGVEKWGFVVIGVLTMFGVYQTPSGITQSQYDQIKEAYGRTHHRPTQ